jgi:hypothetical protein
MDLQAFTAFLEQRLQLDHEPFDQRDVIDYAEEVWPLVAAEDAPDLGRRAAECRKRCRVLAKFRAAAAGGRAPYVHFLERDG